MSKNGRNGEFMEKFSEILKDLIDEKGLSLRKLAKESGVSAVQYGRYLKDTYPTVLVATKIAKYFCVSLDYLFGITDTISTKTLGDANPTLFLPRYYEALKSANITHWKLSQKTDLSESALRRWRSGDTPSMESLVIIALNLSSSIDYLVGRE